MQQSNNAKRQDKKKGGGFVFYPHQYFISDSPATSYAVGVTQGGHFCRVFLDISEDVRDRAKVQNTASDLPGFALFSETHKKARRACFASPDNSSKKPNGILLIEQVERTPSFDDVPTYTGKWASVLQEDDSEPKASPHIGRGYLEVSFNTNLKGDIQEHIYRYKNIIASLENNTVQDHLAARQEIRDLYAVITSSRKNIFAACMIKNEEMVYIDSFSPDYVKDIIRPLLLKYTHDGMYGAVMFRVRDGSNVISESCCQCQMSLDYTAMQVKDVNLVMNDFLKFNTKRIMMAFNAYPNSVIDIIPVQKINCGPKGNSKYSIEIESGPDCKLLKTFVESESRSNPLISFVRENKFLFANVAAKTALIYGGGSSGNVLLSTIHAFSKPKGNAFSIDFSGESTLKMVSMYKKDEVDKEDPVSQPQYNQN